MPSSTPNPPSKRRPSWLLRRADQTAVGGLVLVALVAMAAWWLAQGGGRGQLIELERLPPRTVRFEVDVNTAAWPELAQLPGIGETLAQRIIESREAEGSFADLDELRRVRGIGPRTLDRIKPYLRPLPATAHVAGK